MNFISFHLSRLCVSVNVLMHFFLILITVSIFWKEPFAQTRLPAMFRCAVEIEASFRPSGLQIFVVSDPRCGHCDRALRQIGEWAKNNSSITVIAMDVSEKAGKIRGHEKLQFYSEYGIHIIDASLCGMQYKKFIPKIFVFDDSSEDLIWKLRGWGKGDMDKLKRKLRKHL